MKKKIFALAVIVIYLCIAAFGTAAFYTVDGTAHNIITSGGVDIALEEWHMTEEGLVEYPNEPIDIMPGVKVSKIVKVKGLDEPAWLRVRYDYTVLAHDGKDITDAREVLDEIILIEPDAEHWTYRDGWWYYNESVENGEITEPVFTEVEFSAEKLGNKYERASLIVTVTASAVQVANNGDNALDAAGWAE